MVAPRLQVTQIDPRYDERWLALASSARGSLFTSPPWIRAVCGTYGFVPLALVVTDSEGRPTDGVSWVPIDDIRGRRLVSLPFSDRSEPFVSDPNVWSDLLSCILDSGDPLTIRCLAGAVPMEDGRLTCTAEAAWQATPLDRPIRDIYATFGSTARRNIATAERNGVVTEAMTGLDAVRLYHRLHVSTRKNKYRMLAQPLSMFERIWEEFSTSESIVTVIARVRGEPVAGALYLVWNDCLYYKFGASLADALALRPNDAVTWTALRWASERGLRQLDWGLSDLDQPGLVAYKRKWSSVESRIVTLKSSPQSPRDPDEVAGLLGELTRLLTDTKVPDTLTARAGALMYRYFA